MDNNVFSHQQFANSYVKIFCKRIMRISRFTLFLLFVGLISAIFYAILSSLIAVEDNSELFKNIPSVNRKKLSLHVTDEFNHLFWFLQISDLHLSKYHDLSRISDFRYFCSTTLPKFQTELVIASGDLTDAKTKDNIGSKQFEEEWKLYRSALDNCQVMSNTVWLDVRGNHDTFNVVDRESEQNYYRNYSIQGKKNDRSYLFSKRFNGDMYSFIGIDACIEPGPKRPFNFVGFLSDNETSKIEDLIKESEILNSDYVVWFGHYPTSCILTEGKSDLRKLLNSPSNAVVYLCGHFHKFGGLIPKMYTLQKAGFLELELADWKDNREFRLLAFDHGLFSFVDIKHNDWPVILITNPKDASFLNLKKDPVFLMESSTHIRVLAFSLNNITEVLVRIDEKGDWMACNNVRGPLYVLPWTPHAYQNSLHTIEVSVEDSSSLKKTVKQTFSFSRTNFQFGFLSRIVLMLDITFIFQLMFYIALFTCLFPLWMLRYLHFKYKKSKIDGRWKKPSFNCSAAKKLYFKFWLLSTIDRIYYPLMLYPVYLCVGPWSIGELIDGHVGVIFLWGIFVNGSFLPGTFTYAYGFLQLVTFQVPLTVLIALQTSQRYLKVCNSEYNLRKQSLIIDYLFALLFILHAISAYFFWLSYGTMAFLIGPLRTWPLILSLILYYQSRNLPKSTFM